MTRIGSLFSGTGALDMGVMEVLGGSVAWHVEYDKAPSKILAHHWPDVPNYGDITKVDWSAVEPVDVLTGGSPCQDLSHAGKRGGMTEGTRSNLWVAMREAIAALRPSLVIWENVRGAYSAAADSEMEPCTGCLGGARDRGPSLRALGRVLGDLSELGYVGGWHGLRAADVGAPHPRFRVFVVAHANGSGGEALWGRPWTGDAGRREPLGRSDALLPTPADYDGDRGGPQHPDKRKAGGHSVTLQDAVHGLLGTPTASDWKGSGPVGSKSHDAMLNRAHLAAQVTALLPIPAVNDMGEGKTVDAWDEWTAMMQAAHGNGNGHGKSLAIEAQRLLPTPSVADSMGGHLTRSGDRSGELLLPGVAKQLTERSGHVGAAEGRPAEVLPDVRSGDQQASVRERSPRGSERVPAEAALLADVREQQDGDSARQSSVEGSSDRTAAGVRGVRNDGSPARSPHRPESGEQPGQQSHHPLCVVPSAPALEGGLRAACGCSTDWGIYTEAIRRWEWIIGRAAPSPTQQSTRGRPQLDPRFSEFLMGLPEGHVTGVPGLSRNDMLKALGNGVVWQQAAAAVRFLLNVSEAAA